MKAIIDVRPRNSIFDAVQADISSNGNEDFHLSFDTARLLFSEVTPARLDLLDTLRKLGPSSIYALAKAAGRNYSNVHGDISRLIDLGLVERLEGNDTVFVPFDEVEVHFHLAQTA